MRKFGALCLATFYLLLTTGMFVCLVHCGAEYLLEKGGQALAISDMHEHSADEHHAGEHKARSKDHKGSCGKDKDCSCCNQHGSYVVKENVNNNPVPQLSAILVAYFPAPIWDKVPTGVSFQREADWPDSTGPPYHTDRPLYLSFRSLLI